MERADLLLDSSTLPPDCVQQMQVYLGTRRINADEVDGAHRGAVMGEWCRIDCEGLGRDSPLVIVAARPQGDAPWNFGDCFPRLPDGSSEPNALDLFSMRSLTLKKTLWLFVWGRQVETGSVRDRVAATAWFKEWAEQRGETKTTKPGLKAFFDTLGFYARDLSADPFGGGSSQCGLFLWGDVAQTTSIGLPSPHGIESSDPNALSKEKRKVEALGVFSELDHFLSGAKALLFAKARVKLEDGFPHLDLQLPPKSGKFGDGGLKFVNSGVYFSSPIYFSQEDSRVGVRGDFVFKDKCIRIDLGYPIDGDIIRATGKYTGGPEHFMEDSATFGFPEENGPLFRADDEIELELEFSKSAKTLTKLSFSLEMHEKHWPLIPEPVALSLEGVSFHVTIFDPLDESRAVIARIAAEAAFGDEGDDQFRLLCGGSYPSGQLFLQSRESLPVGSLIEKLVGPAAGVEKLKFDDLRIEYNYRAKLFSLGLDVQGMWEPLEGFKLGDLQFRIQGRDSYSGGLTATLVIAEVTVHLSALYDHGWDFSGSAENLRIGKLIEWLADQVDSGIALPDELVDFTIETLGVQFHSKTKFFQFTCKGTLTLEHTKALAEITVTRQGETSSQSEPDSMDTEPKATPSIKIGGHLTIAKRRFGLSCHKEAGASRMVASYKREGGDRIELRDLIGGDLGEQIPESLAITIDDVYLAYCNEEGDASGGVEDIPAQFESAVAEKEKASAAFSGFLLGADLGASIQLSDIPLAGESLPAGFDAGVDQLRVLLASKAFQTKRLKGINEELGEAKIAELVFPEDPGDAKTAGEEAIVVAKGLSLSAELTLGDYKRAMSLTTAKSKSTQRVKGDAGKTKSLGKTSQAAPASDDSAIVPVSDTGADADAGAQAEPRATAVKSDGGATWITLDKKLGPVDFQRIGLQYQNSALWVLLDVALSSSGLTLSLDGLGVGSPLSDFKPKFKLDGVGIDYKGGGGIEVGGAFLHEHVKTDKGAFDQYSGAALIKTEALKLSAMGSYEEMDGYSSMFVYAFLDKPLGGPAFFFVTGLAAGFGYNRALKSPTEVDEIESFPLVSIAMGNNPVASAKDDTSALLDILSSLGSYVPPAPNKVFLALGVKFNSFKLIDSFALLVATFGDEFRLKLLGLSKIVAPPAESGKTPVAEVTIGLLAEFIPDDGLLKIDGKIMPGSYVLDRDCQLTGGFAFYSWFSGPHDGDFVLTVGGYHPSFRVPAHYPSIERLALNWQVDSDLSVKGTTYFALTSGAVMAGGELEARLDRGRLQAWFDLTADFLVCWQPFHYDIGLAIGIGASYETFLCTFRASLSAAVHLWGPEFAGTARVHFIFVSFTVPFGATGIQKPPPLSWEQFKTSFLPKSEDVCSIAVKDGLARTKKEETAPGGERWIINPKHFALSIDSVVPVKEATGKIQKGETLKKLNGFPSGKSDKLLGIGSMELSEFESILTVTARRGHGENKEDCLNAFRFVPVCKRVPSALWGNKCEADLNGKPIPDVLCGFEVRPAGHPDPGDINDIKCSVLQYNIDPPPALPGPDAAWENPAVPEVTGRWSTEAELEKVMEEARRKMENAFFPDEGDSFDPLEGDQFNHLIAEFLELPQLTSN